MFIKGNGQVIKNKMMPVSKSGGGGRDYHFYGAIFRIQRVALLLISALSNRSLERAQSNRTVINNQRRKDGRLRN